MKNEHSQKKLNSLWTQFDSRWQKVEAMLGHRFLNHNAPTAKPKHLFTGRIFNEWLQHQTDGDMQFIDISVNSSHVVLQLQIGQNHFPLVAGEAPDVQRSADQSAQWAAYDLAEDNTMPPPRTSRSLRPPFLKRKEKIVTEAEYLQRTQLLIVFFQMKYLA